MHMGNASVYSSDIRIDTTTKDTHVVPNVIHTFLNF